ncbi:hypothetical protein SAMN03159341_12012 [Paenibacillus sp. 1_12]|nr:hypothetical protein SAMN03159341_12012 [Paenibacillus sp. 1_12]
MQKEKREGLRAFPFLFIVMEELLSALLKDSGYYHCLQRVLAFEYVHIVDN